MLAGLAWGRQVGDWLAELAGRRRAGWLAGWFAGSLRGWVAGSPGSWIAGRSVKRLGGWVSGCAQGWSDGKSGWSCWHVVSWGAFGSRGGPWLADWKASWLVG